MVTKQKQSSPPDDSLFSLTKNTVCSILQVYTPSRHGFPLSQPDLFHDHSVLDSDSSGENSLQLNIQSLYDMITPPSVEQADPILPSRGPQVILRNIPLGWTQLDIAPPSLGARLLHPPRLVNNYLCAVLEMLSIDHADTLVRRIQGVQGIKANIPK